MAKKDVMPARVFWEPVLWSIVVVSVLMWMIIGFTAGAEIKERNAINARLQFRESLFRSVVKTSHGEADDPVTAVIAAYLREQRGNLDEVLKQERLASSSLTKEQRTMLHLQSPKRFPEPLLLMTNNLEWRALRDDATALVTLKKLLLGDIFVAPDVGYYDTRPAIPRGMLIAWPLVVQMLAFLVYLVNWSDRKDEARNGRYQWYDLNLLTRVCMVFLLPGAAPVLAPMALVAIRRHLRTRWRDSETMSQRRGAGLPYTQKNAQSAAFLKKLQQRVERQREASDDGLLRK